MKFMHLCVVLFTSVNLYAHECILKVQLSPAGNFEAKATTMTGKILVKGGEYYSDLLFVNVDDFSTGIDMRDEHFKKHLNSKKYPKIYVGKVKAKDGKGQGVIKINNIARPVDFIYKKMSNEKLEVTFKLKNSQFNLPKAEYLGVGVEDEIEVIAILNLK